MVLNCSTRSSWVFGLGSGWCLGPGAGLADFCARVEAAIGHITELVCSAGG